MKTISILFLMFYSCSAYAIQNNDLSILNSWVYNIYNSTITSNKFSGFFIFNKTSPYSEILITPSVNANKLYKQCQNNKFDLILAPENIATIVKNKCKYKTILISTQSLKIYTNKHSPKLKFSDLKSIAVLKSSPATKFIINELTVLSPGIKIIEAESGSELIFSLLRDEVDGIVIIKTLLFALMPTLANTLEEIDEFNITKTAHILVPITLNKKKQDFIINSITNNTSSFLIKDFRAY